MEANQAATVLLLQGTMTDGLPDWDHGRSQPLRFIDFDNWQNNDFLVINQFKVELTSGRGHVIPDAVLFVNGIPLVVAEFKSPGIENPLARGDQPAPALLEPAARAVSHAVTPTMRAWSGSSTTTNCSSPATSSRHGRQRLARRRRRIWSGRTRVRCRSARWRRSWAVIPRDAEEKAAAAAELPRSGAGAAGPSWHPPVLPHARAAAGGVAAVKRHPAQSAGFWWPACSARRICWIWCGTSPSSSRSKAGPARSSRGTSSSEQSTRPSSVCRKAARAAGASIATNGAASSGTLRGRAKASAWSFSCGRCGRWKVSSSSRSLRSPIAPIWRASCARRRRLPARRCDPRTASARLGSRPPPARSASWPRPRRTSSLPCSRSIRKPSARG